MISAVLCSIGLAASALALWRTARNRLTAAERYAMLLGTFAVLLLAPLVARLTPAPYPVQRIRTSLVLWVTADATAPAPKASVPETLPSGTDYRTWAFGAWVAVASLLLLRLGVRVIRCKQINGHPDSPTQDATDLLAKRLGIRKTVRIFVCPAAIVPETRGWFRPMIVLPSEARGWTTERMAFVLTHELIHVRRNDWATGLFAEAVTALHWFNPLAWKLLWRLRQERELACDDDVILARSGDAVTYAGHLVDIAAGLGCRSAAGAVAMAHISSLETRVRSILATNKRRGGLTMKGKILAGAIAALAILFTSGIQAPAQGSAFLSGTVQDVSSAYVPGAVVIVRNSAGSGKREITRTAEDGTFQFVALPPGRYALEVSKPGFQLYRQESLDLASGSAQQASVTLQLGRIAETMTVSGTRPQTAAQASTAITPKRVRVGGNVQYAKLIRQEKPVYPPQMKEQGIEGSVLLDAVIGRDGRIINIQPANTLVHPDLVAEAMRAVSLWEYEPTYLNGEPVEVITSITVNFTLTR